MNNISNFPKINTVLKVLTPVNPIETLEFVNGCGDDMRDCSDYYRTTDEPETLCRGEKYKVESINEIDGQFEVISEFENIIHVLPFSDLVNFEIIKEGT